MNGEARGRAVELGAHLVRFSHLERAGSPDERPSARLHLDEAAPLELAQRLPYGGSG